MASARIALAINMTATITNGSAAVTYRRRSARAHPGRPDATTNDPMATAIASLMDKGVDALRETWFQRFRLSAPPIPSADILRRLFAWRLQAEAYGDLDPATATSLKRSRAAVANGKAPTPGMGLRAGTILVREWRGVTHRVLALDAGFEHEGKRYGSLSEVARAISGTRWSGPRFFGIEERPTRAQAPKSSDGTAP
jgi:hypothetical protein